MTDITRLPVVARIDTLPKNLYWIYFHGSIEEQVGYDLSSSETAVDDLPLGESQVRLYGTDKVLTMCLFERLGEKRGYIVDPSNAADLADARRNMEAAPVLI
jgi:hypothetical protein